MTTIERRIIFWQSTAGIDLETIEILIHVIFYNYIP